MSSFDKIKPNGQGEIRNFEYVELLEVAVAVGCSNNCVRYCPQEVLLKAWKNREKIMSLETFKRLLSSVPKSVYLDFAGLTEPFDNPAFLDMAEYASKNGFRYGVKTSLSTATVEGVKRLASLHPTCVFLHLPDGLNFVAPQTEQYHEALIAGLKYLRNTQLSLMNDLFETNNRETTARSQVKTSSGAGWCYRRENPQMVVFPDGTVTICCIDMGLKHVVGNLLTESYSVLRGRFVSKKSYVLCASCSYNVAAWRFHLRKIMQKPRLFLGHQLPLWKDTV
jgi:hypothetical protein